MLDRRRRSLKRLRKRSGWGRRMLWSFATAGACLAVAGVWFWNHPQRSTIAIIGTDSTVTDDAPAIRRSDALLIVTASNHPPQLGLVSMPRDLLMRLPEGEYNRLNAAYANGGAPSTTETIRRNTGVQVFSYAQFDYADVRRFIDALGGIEVEVEVPIGKAYPKGHYDFNGAEALTFIRTRAGSDDFGRSRRLQQVVLPAIVKRVKNDPAALVGAVRFGISYLVAGEHEGLLRSLPLFAVAAVRAEQMDRLTYSYVNTKPIKLASLANAQVLCQRWEKLEPRLKQMFGTHLLAIRSRPHPACGTEKARATQHTPGG